MKLAVNYSLPAAQLLQEGLIQIDYFKCPAWPDLIRTAQEIHPVYVHFPLKVGSGIGDAVDTETNRPADWAKIESLLAKTGTPLVNLHLSPTTKEYPDIPVDTDDPVHIEVLTEQVLKDVQAVVSRLGAERVIVENIYSGRGKNLYPAFLPEVICRVIEETGCGFLFDASHARLAADDLGVDRYEYIQALPLNQIREIHITGLQRFEGRWVELARQSKMDPAILQQLAGNLLDHLPMTDPDWSFFEWLMKQIHSQSWRSPWVIAFEYGGVGPPWEAATEASVLTEQIPRLYESINV